MTVYPSVDAVLAAHARLIDSTNSLTKVGIYLAIVAPLATLVGAATTVVQFVT